MIATAIWQKPFYEASLNKYLYSFAESVEYYCTVSFQPPSTEIYTLFYKQTYIISSQIRISLTISELQQMGCCMNTLLNTQYLYCVL